ncbi:MULTISPECIES: dihydroneopterin aldolase [Chryseobacterium]|uniref:7,8-dihydroneopterin aldolase n=1 Tax=Chryseobacterium camelliae TaxID=1265445 RepID=A0ABU0TKD5_9FLAO|nr:MULTISPECIES: dihydroneopterin aldolase [Chryseobacterium]MDT3408685.1 dihydroneopterin aldolase [Pseudacidovorax intermedius]MDQ1097461.1 dihydroneopterin aldolase [Chryseobacterium camelliae]MDQ1101390.1 dihydroneopterin aldolase [Chryseobacterium sp. SORGH_AS_1048]MDR6084834.1 dihydroneopterin aldolase [Chryseobacterium sp. SORGH_AS_0909]MDR6129183.1 dihydroneopterin aldolase [Chryseobacterium sp. SORGH_AS_1175]
MSRIFLEDVKIYAYHGVLPEENLVGTYYIVNAELHTDLWKASESDDLNDTVSYAEINSIIHDEMGIPSKLMEHVAGRIINRIHEKFSQIDYIKIKITKTSPPMQGEMRGASIELDKMFKP